MDMFIKKRNMNAEHQTNSDSSSQSDDGDINETEASSAKRIRTSFTRKYNSLYIRYGFVSADDAGIPKPQCVICGDVLSNDAMKPSKLQINTRHKDISSKPKEFFERKGDNLKSSQKLIFDSSHINTSALRASYKVALRIAKS